MAGRTGIALEGVHWLFWEQREPTNNELVITQKQLAEMLAVERARAGQVITGLVTAGRITKVERSTYVIADPAGWAPEA